MKYLFYWNNEKQFVFAITQSLMNFIENKLDKKQAEYDSVEHEFSDTFWCIRKYLSKAYTAFEIFISLHNNRKQSKYVKCNNTMQINSTGWVAQGSIQSGSECALYKNNFFNLNIKGKLLMYADDAVVMLAARNIIELLSYKQNDNIIIDNWSKHTPNEYVKIQLHFFLKSYIKHKENCITTKFFIYYRNIFYLIKCKTLGKYLKIKKTWFIPLS